MYKGQGMEFTDAAGLEREELAQAYLTIYHAEEHLLEGENFNPEAATLLLEFKCYLLGQLISASDACMERVVEHIADAAQSRVREENIAFLRFRFPQRRLY